MSDLASKTKIVKYYVEYYDGAKWLKDTRDFRFSSELIEYLLRCANSKSASQPNRRVVKVTEETSTSHLVIE